VSEVLADHHDATITTNDFALIANLLHARLDLHDPPSILCLLVSVNDPTSGEVVRT
jgi:hypothetical protein